MVGWKQWAERRQAEMLVYPFVRLYHETFFPATHSSDNETISLVSSIRNINFNLQLYVSESLPRNLSGFYIKQTKAWRVLFTLSDNYDKSNFFIFFFMVHKTFIASFTLGSLSFPSSQMRNEPHQKLSVRGNLFRQALTESDLYK